MSAETAIVDTGAKLIHHPAAPRDEQLRAEIEVHGYQRASTGALTKEEAEALRAPFADDQYDMKPTETGEVFVGQVHVRHRLNSVIGPLQWALVPVPNLEGHVFFKDGSGDRESILMRGRLYIRDHFVSEAIGEQAMASGRMTYASACEGAKSDTLTRCAKDLSIGWECWDKRWCDRWRAQFAVRVMVKKKGDTKTLWRRKDVAPISGEIILTDADLSARTDEAPLQTAAAPHAPTATSAGPTREPLLSKSEAADLWAVLTETFTRQRADAMGQEIVRRHGFKNIADITKVKLPAILADIRKAGAA
jgi:hypothetical protein